MQSYHIPVFLQLLVYNVSSNIYSILLILGSQYQFTLSLSMYMYEL